ncbi:transglycosylase SLT domain-containing protein [Saccharopolyspora gloriosae]|uniref:transglycosylase SLT domain-containing protein n=1 Tax=Saccharopolyspora gloriosae TaxID=455344 RepID=UPI001FB78581|nr:transglycosylase SLT domain-containing protein [Saccharopolyspora gloriosae]
MTTLSPEQIAQHAYDAGFRGEDLSTAVAVAVAESSGNTEAHNGAGLDDSYGLWQINMLGDMGPARREEYGIDSNEELLDPATNAEAAYKIHQGRGDFSDWSTYNDDSYKKHLDEARKAAAQVEGGGDPGTEQPSGPPGGTNEQPPGNDNGSENGFTVETDLLTDYAEAVEGIAEELGNIGKRALDSITGLTPNSFGEVGAETGFAAALADLGKSLDKQVAAVGESARSLGAAAAETAKTYLQADDDSIKALEQVLKS